MLKASPTKRKALNEFELLMTPKKKQKIEHYDETIGKLANNLQALKKKRTKSALQQKRILSSFVPKRSAKAFGVSWAYLEKTSMPSSFTNEHDQFDRKT